MNKLNFNKPKTNTTPSPNQELYHPIFQVGKAWPSGLERRLKKYGWYSSGRTKKISNPESNHISTPELNHHSIHGRRSRALAHALPTLNRRWYSSSQKNAFTIIEVVLVLAIAGLIFLMVFIALPALQRSQRNTGYKTSVSSTLGSIQNYKSNNKNQLPPATDSLGFSVGSSNNSAHPFYRYSENIGLPEATSVKIWDGAVSSVTTIAAGHSLVYGRIGIYTNAKCAANSTPYAIGAAVAEREIGKTAVWTILEESNGLIYCEDV